MRRWITIFLIAFLPPAAVMLYFATRGPGAAPAGSDAPLVGRATGDLPPKGQSLAEAAQIYVYEGDRELARISGRTAVFEGRERAVFQNPEITAWPEKGQLKRQPTQVAIRADRAEVDREKRTARLSGRVRVDSPEGDRLTAETMILDFNDKTVKSDGLVEIVSRESRFRGTGFHGSIALRSFRFDRDVEGTLLETRGDLSPAGASKPGEVPEDVTFRAGGPVTAEPLEDRDGARRTRLVMDGGVDLTRVDPATKSPTRVVSRTLTLDFRREVPAPPPDAAHAPSAPQPRLFLERLAASGDVTITDPRGEIKADELVSDNRTDGSSVTTVKGPAKRVVFRERPPVEFGSLGRVESTGKGPVEVTCMDDLRIVRGPNLPTGEPGIATVGLSRWVQVRDGGRQLDADALVMQLRPRRGRDGGGFGYAPRCLEATGNVLVVEPGRSARADRLYWDAVSDRLWMWGAPAAEVADAKTRLRARRIVFDNRLGLVTLTDSVDLEGEGGGGVAPAGIFNLSPRGGPDGTHWRLRCRRLEATMKDQDISGLHAAGDVEIRTEDTVTTSETLSYDHDIARLTGHPVRIESGRDFVEARAVTMDAKRKTALLTGVKRMTMHVKGGMQGLVGLTPAQPEAASAETPVTLTCRGPVWVDQTRGAFVARDGVVVTTKSLFLTTSSGWSHFTTSTPSSLRISCTYRSTCSALIP